MNESITPVPDEWFVTWAIPFAFDEDEKES